MKEINIKTLSLVELKALAFDLYVQRDSIVNNINIVSKELQDRIDAPINDVLQEKEVSYKKDLSDNL